MKTFYISYYSNKDGKMITRRGKEDDKTKFGINKKTQVPYFIYFDIDMKPPKKISTGKTPKPPLNDIAKAIMQTANPNNIISSRPNKSAISTSLSNYL